ncbi:MAG: hypothetical protein HKP61_17310 [Dactylosporangium sp.]|nr:alpha-L-rhamnosidase N-terminal domain-containing protein [Dactylosporangium sp.]NNJ62665.1 hypothetical protein [Dactylosporangium sp.]
MSRPRRRQCPPSRRTARGRWFLLILVLVLAASAGTALYMRQTTAALGELAAVGLRTEYLTDPVGIDAATPRLSWVATAAADFTQQHAYQVQVAESSTALREETDLRWDSGQVDSAQTWGIGYAGTPLVSGHRYVWRVRLWDASRRASEWSETASWQMGLLDEAAWGGAAWISASAKTAPAAVLLRRGFTVGQGKVVLATLTVAGVGFHVPYLNGSRVGDSEMAPAWTDYTDRIAYMTYDVTSLVRTGGDNMLGISLAGGWYHPNGPDTAGLATLPYVDQEKLRARLDVRHSGGETVTVVSDDQWRWATGDVTYASVRGGEDIDHTKSRADWSAAGGSAAGFTPVSVDTPPKGQPKLVATAMPPERKAGTVPLTSRKTATGYVYTLDRNTTGTLLLLLTGSPGTIVRVQVGEGLSGDRVSPDWHGLNERVGTGRWQQANFTLGSSSRETFETSFTYFAGSYVELRVIKGKLTEPPALQVYEVHTDVDSAGTFTSSDEKLTALHDAVRRTYLNNLHGYPLSNPQRDRLGYGVDAAALIDTALLNFRGGRVYAKWAADLRDAQIADGSVPLTAPAHREPGSSRASPWWGNAVSTIALQTYRFDGDLRLLEEQYPAMHRYAEYVLGVLSEGLWTVATALTPDLQAVDAGDAAQFNTLGAYVAIQNFADTAEILGRREDMYTYRGKAEEIRAAFNARWFNKEQHTYARRAGAPFRTAPQSVLATAIGVDIVPDGERDAVLASLLADIAKPSADPTHADHLVTGIVGTRYLFQVLSDAGAVDVAYRILTQDTYPGVLPAATAAGGTLHERTTDAGLSQDSPGFGSFDTWLFRGVGGIQLDEVVSTGLIRIRPTPVTGVEWAEAEVVTVRGTVSSRWERTSTGVRYRITVPIGSAAEVSVVASPGNVAQGSTSIATFADPAAPDRQVLHLRSGTYVVETR